MKQDRLDMLKKISLIDKHKNLHVFKSYIPDHYDEIYTLYTLLKESNIDYSDIEFKEPLEENSKFSFRCQCKNSDIIDFLQSFLNKNVEIKYMRKHAYTIDCIRDENDIILTFNRI